MITAEAALRSLLVNGSPNPVAAIVNSRVYPRRLPDGVVYPAIRYARVSTQRSPYRDLTGYSNYARPRFQIDCYTTSEDQCLTLANAVRQVLDGFVGVSAGLKIDALGMEDEAAELDPEAGVGGSSLYRQRLDFFMSHPE
jgi:uncharacterized protein DUF3168